jgi:hypothetical protein
VSDLLTTAPALPRIAHYPRAPYSSGPEFTELAASAGLILDDWQARDMTIGLGENEDGKWASFQVTEIVPRQNGKDGIAEALGLGWLFLTDERLIGHSAHEYKTAMEAFRRLVALIENTDDLRRQVKRIAHANGEEAIELLNGNRMRFLARSKGAGRGFSFDKLLWNEAYALTSAQVDATLPALSARPNPQLWLMSSPPLDPASGEALFRARAAALAGVKGVTYLDYGADFTLDNIGPCRSDRCTHRPNEDGCILDDLDLRGTTNPAYPHRIGDEAIDRERATMDPTGFARERLGAWPPDLSAGYTVINSRQWDRMAIPTEGITMAGRPALAVDVSPRSAGPVRSAISAAYRTTEGVTVVEMLLSGPGSAWVPQALGILNGKWKPCAVVLDPGSPAGSIHADVAAQGIDTVPMAARDVAAAFGMIYDAATSENPGERIVAHVGQPELALSLRGATTRNVGDGGQAWDRRTASTDITPLVSVTNALWGLLTKGTEEEIMPWVVFA